MYTIHYTHTYMYTIHYTCTCTPYIHTCTPYIIYIHVTSSIKSARSRTHSRMQEGQSDYSDTSEDTCTCSHVRILLFYCQSYYYYIAVRMLFG